MVKDFLYSEKKIYDSIHGFIPFDEFEKELIDSLPFQRLHHIHQLGMAYLVYPGATHTRFEHSLGVMHLATQIFEKICKTVRPDVFHFVPRKGSADYLYWRRVLRMAALCHDLGHFAFSHSLEHSQSSEEWTLEIMESAHLQPVWKKLCNAPPYLEDLIQRDILRDIQKIAIGEARWKKRYPEESFTPWERIVSQVITSHFFGADRIDYLLRDAKSTGVGYGLFDSRQLIESLRVLPSFDQGVEELQLGIDENGLESCEALLLARHFMQRRVYQYSSVKAYSFHLSRFIGVNPELTSFKTVDDFLAVSDPEVLYLLNKAAKESKMAGHEDAKCIYFRQHRFRAVSLPSTISEKDLEEFKEKKGLSDREISWEFVEAARNQIDNLSFPVSRRHVIVQRAKDCSDILFRFPKKRRNWAYISPDHDLNMANFLESWNA